MNKEELKVLLYRYIESAEYEYIRAHRVCYYNWQLQNTSDGEPEELEVSLIKLFASQKEMESVKKVCSDIARILDNDREL